MKEIKIKALQADIIYHALGYVAEKFDLEMTDKQKELYRIVSEDNPSDNDVTDVLDIMDMLVPLLKEEYSLHYDEDED